MGRAVTFGIVGGCGATGRIVASELWKSSDAKILIGGRDLTKTQELAAEFDGRVSPSQLDVLDGNVLDDFCSRCSIIINCAGPVMVLQDRVAQAAFRNRCHYIDAAGMSLTKERMLFYGREVEDLGLSFVISAGWNPGISEILPAYAHARAKAEMDAIDSLSVYFGDSGHWSTNALRDAAWYIRQTGLRSPGYFRKGEWTRAKMSEASRRIDLGDPIGPGRFAMFALPEMVEVGRRLNDCDVFTYTYLSGYRTALSTMLMALIPLPEAWNVGLLRGVFRRNRGPVDGFVAAHVLGRKQGFRIFLKFQITYTERRDYWITAVALATVAGMISRSEGVRPGVHFLADAADPIAVMSELRKVGINQTENLHPCERDPIPETA